MRGPGWGGVGWRRRPLPFQVPQSRLRVALVCPQGQWLGPWHPARRSEPDAVRVQPFPAWDPGAPALRPRVGRPTCAHTGQGLFLEARTPAPTSQPPASQPMEAVNLCLACGVAGPSLPRLPRLPAVGRSPQFLSPGPRTFPARPSPSLWEGGMTGGWGGAVMSQPLHFSRSRLPCTAKRPCPCPGLQAPSLIRAGLVWGRGGSFSFLSQDLKCPGSQGTGRPGLAQGPGRWGPA